MSSYWKATLSSGRAISLPGFWSQEEVLIQLRELCDSEETMVSLLHEPAPEQPMEIIGHHELS